MFVQRNILPRRGHLNEPTCFDLWLVYSILIGRKVNLGFLIIRHMAKVLTSSRIIWPYGMLLTTIFQFFGVDLDSESDIRMSKPSHNTDNACIAWLGYEYDGHHWVEKAARAPVVVDVETNKEAEMDIPPSSPIAPHSPPTALSTIVGSSTAPLDWYQWLSQCLDTMSLAIQQMNRDHQDDMCE